MAKEEEITIGELLVELERRLVFLKDAYEQNSPISFNKIKREMLMIQREISRRLK